jgi:hypothetical protein
MIFGLLRSPPGFLLLAMIFGCAVAAARFRKLLSTDLLD